MRSSQSSKSEHIYYFYRKPLLSEERKAILLEDLQAVAPVITGVESERIFTVASGKRLSNSKKRRLRWILKNRHQPKNLSEKSFISGENIIEINPRLAFETPESTNAVGICKNIGLESVSRLEQGRRFKIESSRTLSKEEFDTIARLLYDPMVEAIDAPASEEMVPAVCERQVGCCSLNLRTMLHICCHRHSGQIEKIEFPRNDLSNLSCRLLPIPSLENSSPWPSRRLCGQYR